MKVIYITDFMFLGHSGGAHLTRAHYNSLCEYFGLDNVTAIAVTYAQDIKENGIICYKSYNNILGQLANVFSGNPHCMSNRIVKNIMQLVKEQQADIVFLDNGYFGKLCRMIKQNYPNTLVVVFNHGILKSKTNQQITERKRKIYYWHQVIGLLRGEKQTSVAADVNMVINDRDGDAFYRAYGRKADMIFPAYIEDNGIVNREVVKTHNAEILFVGGKFYPNIYGVKWFVSNVLDNLDCNAKMYVVGRGLECLRDEPDIKNSENVVIIGGVEDLSEWYNRCNIVVGPIFHGDGMKTKTAEALMYGKLFIGTEEAICGYPDLKRYQCDTAEQFISLINDTCKSGVQSYYPDQRKIYEKCYSGQMALNIIDNLVKHYLYEDQTGRKK